MRRPLAILAVLLVAGCGGSGRMSRKDFEQHLKRDAVLASRAAANAATAAGNSMQVYARRVARAQEEMHQAAEDLDSLQPPKDAAADVDRIVVGLRFLDKELGKLHHAAATSNEAEAKAVSAAVDASPELRAVNGAIKDLQRKGYDVGVFGS
ncbi:MAG TPA: hypothetical protein VGK79_06230 [Gaiellaceae bacterium]